MTPRFFQKRRTEKLQEMRQRERQIDGRSDKIQAERNTVQPDCTGQREVTARKFGDLRPPRRHVLHGSCTKSVFDDLLLYIESGRGLVRGVFRHVG